MYCSWFKKYRLMFNIDIELKSAWIRQLREDWRNANYCAFNGKMHFPEIDLLFSEKTLGKWEGGRKRRLSVSLFLVKNYPWQYAQEILYHEMAHQYVEEILKITNDLPHGKAFKKVCYENGIDHRASGDIESWIYRKSSPKAQSPNHKILDKIQKLLSLAQSPNSYEAELAMTRAQELLLKHNISLLELEIERKYLNKQIGEVGKRNPIKSLIGKILNKYFFVEALWIPGYDQKNNKKGRILEIYGTPENVEMAEYIHDYLHNVSEMFWKEYKRHKNIRGNKHRRSFIYGLLNGFYEKLEAGVSENKSKSLVWKGDPGLKDYYHRRNPKIQQSVFYHSRSCKEAYNSGIARGRNLIIHKGVNARQSGKVYFLDR